MCPGHTSGVSPWATSYNNLDDEGQRMTCDNEFKNDKTREKEHNKT